MYTLNITWFNREKQLPENGHRIIVLSPVYQKDDPMRIRIIDSQFYGISKDAQYWAYINEPKV